MDFINLSTVFLQTAIIHFRENEKLQDFLTFSSWLFYELLINIGLSHAVWFLKKSYGGISKIEKHEKSECVNSILCKSAKLKIAITFAVILH